jgi:DNA-binding beta-propeller fold protein YncE
VLRRTILATALLALLAVAATSLADHVVVSTWGTRGPAPGQLDQPGGVAVDGAGNVYVYVADTLNHRIQKFSADGALLAAWGSQGTGTGQFSSPWDVALDAAGNVYVADRNNNRVQKFDANGGFLLAWGTVGTGDGQFRHPVGIDVDPAGNVFVSDFDNYRIQRFTADGTFVAKWGSRGTAPSQFELPYDVAADGAGNVYVLDGGNHRIQRFDADGALRGVLGGPGTAPGQLSTGSGGSIDVDPAGNLYVSDTDNNRIQVLDPAGAFLEAFGSRGAAPGQFNRQYGVALAPGGDVYVSDRGNYRMQRFRKPAAQPSPAPEAGRTVVAAPLRGTVLVRKPGSTRYEELRGPEGVPVGSLVDTRRGKLRLTSASDARGGTQSGDFESGLFQVRQRRSSRPVTELVLKGGSFRSCRRGTAGAQAAQRARSVRRVRGNARGRFRTRGRYSAATVRGTVWEVTDRCDGTLTRVRRGRVEVRDFRARRVVQLRAGRSYLARAPRR